jgi:hypothetical protein
MVKYIGLFLMLYFVTSCKYREHKATYSIVEIDTIDGEIERDLENFDETDTLKTFEGSFINNK